MEIKSLLMENLLNEASSKPRKALLISTKKKSKPSSLTLKKMDERLKSMYPDSFVKLVSEDDEWLDVTVYMKNFTLADAISSVKKIKASMDVLVGEETLVSIVQ